MLGKEPVLRSMTTDRGEEVEQRSHMTALRENSGAAYVQSRHLGQVLVRKFAAQKWRRYG